MAIACLTVFRRGQLLEGELPNGLEHPEAGLAIGAGRDRQEVLVGQAAEASNRSSREPAGATC